MTWDATPRGRKHIKFQWGQQEEEKKKKRTSFVCVCVCVEFFFFTDDMQRDIRSHGMNKQTATTHAPGDFFLVEFFFLFCFVYRSPSHCIRPSCGVFNNQQPNAKQLLLLLLLLHVVSISSKRNSSNSCRQVLITTVDSLASFFE